MKFILKHKVMMIITIIVFLLFLYVYKPFYLIILNPKECYYHYRTRDEDGVHNEVVSVNAEDMNELLNFFNYKFYKNEFIDTSMGGFTEENMIEFVGILGIRVKIMKGYGSNVTTYRIKGIGSERDFSDEEGVIWNILVRIAKHPPLLAG